MIDNNTFLQALFEEDTPFVHVTDFMYDPGAIPKEEHLRAWSGDWFSRYTITPGSNQYFTVSIFNPDDTGKARRRKALFLRTRVIVLDDVKEKLSLEEVMKLPAPAWVLETSPGSEQWGYILNEPAHQRHQVENLLDGLVANGLAPDGRDPGMKGVTRYVRLPEGYNNKASKLVGGLPFKCRITNWNPERRVTLEQLATPFNVNLNAERREARVDGAANVPDHPLLQIPEIIAVKEIRSDGRFDITCPWVNDHTGADDSGSAIFTNEDGTMGFKCHHGACQHKTGRDLMRHIESVKPGFGANYQNWMVSHAFKDLAKPPVESGKIEPSYVSFIEPVSAPPVSTTPAPAPVDGLDKLIGELRRIRPNSPEARELAQNILKFVDTLPEIDRLDYHKEVQDAMHWTKHEFLMIIRDLRKTWYNSGDDVETALDFLDNMTYVQSLDQIYDFKSNIFYAPTTFQNSFCHIDTEIKKKVLQDNLINKVHFIDFDPGKEKFFKDEKGITYANLWNPDVIFYGAPGDVTPWLDHFKVLGWGAHMKHILQWMAFTLRHPERKINHMLLLGGAEGIGKDFLLDPLKQAMTSHHFAQVDGVELLENYNDYLIGRKFVVFNEAELGDHREARQISNKIKPLTAAPPDRLRVNQKYVSAVEIKNIVNICMTTNSRNPLELSGTSRRIYAMWSDLRMRDPMTLEVRSEWSDYWSNMWKWYSEEGGMEACIDYLYTKVDLSDFNPAVAPPVTDFLRDIQESSKSPWEVTIDNLINHRVGAFACDMLTSSDAAESIRGIGVQHHSLLQMDPSRATSVTMGKVLGSLPNVVRRTLNPSDGPMMKLWVIRNDQYYAKMSANEVYSEYQKQINMVRNGIPMTTPGKPNLQLVNFR